MRRIRRYKITPTKSRIDQAYDKLRHTIRNMLKINGRSHFRPVRTIQQYVAQRDKEVVDMRAALESAIIALDDWSRTVAPEFYNESDVSETNDRIRQNGTVYYIATVLEQCRKSLK